MESFRPQSSSTTVAYHSLFNYPLSKNELGKWRAGKKVKLPKQKTIPQKEKRERKKFSIRKLQIAKKAAKILKRLPLIKMIAVTGSLAMQNAKEDSDIDLMIATARNSLWTTRLVVSFLLLISGLKLRRAGDKDEKDKLCLNIWLDEADLKWRKQNIFTAHEICQIVPLVNKDKTYERFLWENKWVLAYWPKAVEIAKLQGRSTNINSGNLRFIEPLAYKFQRWYMSSKITRETITPTRALFHPVDWSARLENQFDQD